MIFIQKTEKGGKLHKSQHKEKSASEMKSKVNKTCIQQQRRQ